MAITYPLTLPASPVPTTGALRMRSAVGLTRSPFTGEESTQIWGLRLWELSLSYPPMVRADAEQIIAFLGKLGGREGTFLAGDPNGATPRGTASVTPGTPVTVGSAQSGTDVDIDGCPVGEVGYLLAGDYISLGTGVNTHLHKVLDDVNTDSIGAATLTLWPRLRENPQDGATVTVSNAVGTFRLTTNVSEFDINQAQHYGVEFSALESPNFAGF